MHANSSLAVCHAEAALQAPFLTWETKNQHPRLTHFALPISTPLKEDAPEIQSTNSVFSGSFSIFHQWSEKCDCAEKSGISLSSSFQFSDWRGLNFKLEQIRYNQQTQGKNAPTQF